MDATNLMLSMLAGCVGMAMVTIGKRTSRMVPIGAGIALLTFPYFIANAVALTAVCAVLIALPFVFRDA